MIIIFAKYLFLISFVLGGTFFLTLPINDKKRMVFFGFLSGVISLVLLKMSSALINDPRPFVVDHVMPLISHAPDNGFPSDHTLLTMWLALVVCFYNKRVGTILIIISLIVGISRVMALVHHPVDILGSIIIAIVSVLASNVVINKLMRH